MSEIISYDEKPYEKKWSLEKIYCKKKNGNVMFWEIGYNPKHKRSLWVKRGQVGNDTTRDSPDVVRKAGKTYQQQALQEAKNLFIKKIRNGYSKERNPTISIHKPQLAKKYITDMKFVEYHFKAGIACQAKADGIRGIAILDGPNVRLITREGLKHFFLEELKEELRIFLIYLPNDCAIDGELLLEGKEFNELQKVVMKKKKKHKDNDKVELFVFDIMIPGYLEERINILLKAYKKFTTDNPKMKRIKLLPHCYVFSEKQLEHCYQKTLELGYEGMMMRKLCGGQNKLVSQSLYNHKRTANLVKYKPFDDTEGKIIAVKSGKNKDKNKAIFVVEDDNGLTFTLKPGKDKERIQYLQNPKKVIGKICTYKYQGRFPSGLPRFPTWIGFRENGI